AGIGSLEADADEPVFVIGFQGRGDLDVLVVVDLEAGERAGDGGVLDGEGFLKPDDSRIELAGLVKVIDFHRDVGNPDNARALCRQQGYGEENGQGEGFDDHIVAVSNYGIPNPV